MATKRKRAAKASDGAVKADEVQRKDADLMAEDAPATEEPRPEVSESSDSAGKALDTVLVRNVSSAVYRGIPPGKTGRIPADVLVLGVREVEVL